jgi:carbonic anhydrase
MSDYDFVQKAALRALSRSHDKKPPLGAGAKKPKNPSTSPADPETSQVSQKKSAGHRKKNKLPEKGSAEATVHKMAAKAAVDKKNGSSSKNLKNNSQGKQDNSLSFLFLVLLLPLAVVGGLYTYASNMRDKKASTGQASQNLASAAKTKNEKQVSSKASPGKTVTRAPKAPTVADLKKAEKKQAISPQPVAIKPAAPIQKTATPPPPHPQPTVTMNNKAATAPLQAANTPATAKASAKTHKSHWDYSSTDWASLDPSFKTCGTGQMQSPIDIQPINPPAGPVFQYNYFPSNAKVHNNGHSVQVDLAKGNQLLVNGKAYELIQFHFHTPSENLINGRRYPMEVHLVHKNAQNKFAVVAIMITEGGGNQLLAQMPVPQKKGDSSKSTGAHINPILLLPANHGSFTFTGSLTTPPCTQNVGWIVLQNPLLVSRETLTKFQKVLGKNNRPVQPENGRIIYASQ